MNNSIRLRPASQADQDFLYRVYASTRLDELAPLGWSEAQLEAFLTMQFNAQHRFYHDQFAEADFQVILAGNVPIGRLYLGRWENEFALIDIALLPEHRGAGIGTALIKDVLAEAAQAGKPVRIHVEMFNPALRLYQRLGFSQIADNGIYYLMEWSPPARGSDE